MTRFAGRRRDSHSLQLTPTHSSHSVTPTHSHSLPLTPTHSHSLPLTPTHSHTHSHSLPLTPTHSHSLPLTPTHSNSLPLIHSHSVTPTHSHSLPLTPTHSHSLPVAKKPRPTRKVILLSDIEESSHDEGVSEKLPSGSGRSSPESSLLLSE